VTGEGIRRIAALAVVVFATGALTACGDSSSSATDSSSSTETSSSTNTGSGDKSGSKGSRDGSGSQSKRDGESPDSAPAVDPAPLKVSGGGSSQFRNEGGDNSIQEFGEESDETELDEAATALHGYFVARAREEWSAACSYLATTVRDQLSVLASRSDQLKDKGCAEILTALTPPLPAAVRHESTIVDAGSLRLEDERAFLIYRGAEETEYAMLMEQEDDAWKVGSISATPIS